MTAVRLICRIVETTQHGLRYNVFDGDRVVAEATSSDLTWVRHDAGGYHTKEKFDALYPESWTVEFDFSPPALSRDEREEAALQAVIDQMMLQRNGVNNVRQQARKVIDAYRAAIAEPGASPAAYYGAALERFVEALTPSGNTMRAYHGRFKMEVAQYDPETEDWKLVDVMVDWDTVKNVMNAVHERATGKSNR